MGRRFNRKHWRQYRYGMRELSGLFGLTEGATRKLFWRRKVDPGNLLAVVLLLAEYKPRKGQTVLQEYYKRCSAPESSAVEASQ